MKFDMPDYPGQHLLALSMSAVDADLCKGNSGPGDRCGVASLVDRIKQVLVGRGVLLLLQAQEAELEMNGRQIFGTPLVRQATA
tara:strand:+ start:1876 stop:2127 length:252 start_codon:yes stop_codon:yes gene_type:complete